MEEIKKYRLIIKNLQPMNDTNEMMIQNFHRIK